MATLMEEDEMRRGLWELVGVAGLFLANGACESAVTGNEGNFLFSYPADDRVFDFNKPIAVGAFLDMEVKDAGDRSDIELSSAKTEDTSVLTVESTDGNSVTLKAVGEGETSLTVEGTTQGGEAQSDSVNLLARVPEVHTLRHTCGATEAEAAYLTGQQIYIAYEFEMSDGQPVIGYGYYPVTPSIASMVVDESFKGSQFIRFDLSGTGTGTLDSDLTSSSLGVRIVGETDLDGVEEPVSFTGEDIGVGSTKLFYVRPTTAGMPVCQALTPVVVHSDTPSICTVTLQEGLAGDLDAGGKEHGWFALKGLTTGNCLYTVEFPHGTAATAQFSQQVQP